MPALMRKLGWVAVIIFVIEAVFIVAGPNLSNTIKQEFKDTADRSVLVSQGAGLLLIAAGILLASTVFALPDQPPGTRDENAADDPVWSSGTVMQRRG